MPSAGKPGSRSRSICRQDRFTSRAAIIPRASPFRGGSAISGWRTRSRAGSSRFRLCRCSMPPDGRTPNFSAFGSASRNASNRVSPARNAVSRQRPTPQPSSRGSARSWPCRAMENGREIHPRPTVLASSKIQARILRRRHSLDTHDPPCDIAGASAACVTTGAE
jgi:hypothetical protein